MADNATLRGFRWSHAKNGASKPPIRWVHVATGYGTLLVNGDPLKFAADGLQRAAAGDTLICGVMIGARYWDGTFRIRRRYLPANTSWGTDQTKISMVAMIPVQGQVFEVDADDKVTATTEAGYQALINENADHIIESVTGNISGAALDISTHAITTAQWRIVGYKKYPNHDYSGLRVKLLVECNESEEPAFNTAVSA